MAEVINYTRLTTSDKLQDRFLTCQVYQPLDPEQAQSGMIFSQIEILSPWFPTSQVGQTVINTLIREYYRGSDTSDLINFESAIKKVNEALAQIAQNGETDWIGKFSGVLMLINGSQAHFAQTGLSQAYLYRGSHLNNITEGLNGDEAPHPLKTFSNLTSGSLQEGDKIVVANAAFFESVSPTDIKMLVTSFRPTVAAIEIAKLLRNQKNGQNGNALFIELTTKEELANVPPDQKIEAIYLDQPVFSLALSLREFFSSVLIPGAKRTGNFIAKSFGRGKEKLASHLKRGLERSKEYAGHAAKAISSVSNSAKDKFSEKIISKTSINKPAELNAEDSADSRQDVQKSPSITKIFLRMKNRLRRFLIHSGLYSPKKSKMILAVLIAIVLVLGGAIAFSLVKHAKTKNTASLQTTLDQIASIQTEATLASSKKDDKTAVNDYQKIISLASTLKGTKFDAQASQSSKNAQDKIAEITKLQSLTPVAQITLKTDGSNLAILSDTVYLFSKNGEASAKKSSDKDFAPVTTSGQKIVVSSTALTDDGKIACTTNDKTILIFDPEKKTFETQDVPLKYAGVIRSFFSALYILDQPANQIYKVSPKDGAYHKTSEYLKDNSIISDSVDMAIDGSVYLLSADGKINRYSRGNKIGDVGFVLPASEKLSGYKRIFTSELVDNIMLFSDTAGKARIIEIDKNAKFIGQFNLEGADGGQDITIDLSTRAAYVLKGTQILSYKF